MRRREEERKEEEEGGEGENRGREGRRAAVIAHEMFNEDELTGRSERQMQAESHMVSAKAGDGVGLLFSRQSPSAFTSDCATVTGHGDIPAPVGAFQSTQHLVDSSSDF